MTNKPDSANENKPSNDGNTQRPQISFVLSPEPNPIKDWAKFGGVGIAPEAVEYIGEAVAIIGQLGGWGVIDFAAHKVSAGQKFERAVEILSLALAKAARGVAQVSPYEDVILYDEETAEFAESADESKDED